MDSKLSVIRCSRSLVQPCEQTPCATLHLSPIDSLPALRCNARTLHVFKDAPHEAAPAAVIRQALSRALVPYYPLAGRLNQQAYPLQLDCTNQGQGVLFVEASSSNTLASLNYLDDLTSIPLDLLLPELESEAESEALVQMQVTQFACGGFVMGLIFCHSICDGLGAAQFLNAVGELARGVDPVPTITPKWHRDFFPKPLNAINAINPQMPPPVMPDYSLQHSNIDIPIDRINRLKKQFQESTGGSCSAFEIVAACFWRSRTRAVYEKSNNSEEVKLVFFANCRELVEPPLPKGFYGNCFFPVTISRCCRGIGEAAINEVVKLIQEAKSRVGREMGEYMRRRQMEEGRDSDPFAPPLNYSTLFISEWGRLGFNQVDYGWGPPVHVVPIQGSAVIPVGIVGCLPLPRKGIRLMTWCVQEPHRPSFLHHISQLFLL